MIRIKINESEDKKEKKNEHDLMLPRGKDIILKAEDKDYDRGLVVTLLEDGGYDVYYWYDDPSTPVAAELKADGEKIGDDIKKVYLGYHPELDEE